MKFIKLWNTCLFTSQSLTFLDTGGDQGHMDIFIQYTDLIRLHTLIWHYNTAAVRFEIENQSVFFSQYIYAIFAWKLLNVHIA